MKFTLSWLKDHLDTTATIDALSEALTDLGLEVEEVSNRAARLGAFTLARITHAERRVAQKNKAQQHHEATDTPSRHYGQ